MSIIDYVAIKLFFAQIKYGKVNDEEKLVKGSKRWKEKLKKAAAAMTLEVSTVVYTVLYSIINCYHVV